MLRIQFSDETMKSTISTFENPDRSTSDFVSRFKQHPSHMAEKQKHISELLENL